MNRKATTLTSSPPVFPKGTLLRYVVLHHIGFQTEHFDLLLEPPPPPDQPLLTWRVEPPPSTWTPTTPAIRQPDHRPIYMTYEGEISNNRGRVQRVAKGTAKVVIHDRQSLHVDLTGDLTASLMLPL